MTQVPQDPAMQPASSGDSSKGHGDPEQQLANKKIITSAALSQWQDINKRLIQEDEVVQETRASTGLSEEEPPKTRAFYLLKGFNTVYPKVPKSTTSTAALSHGHPIADIIKQVSEQAAQEGHQALFDACLLIVEALHMKPEGELHTCYRQDPVATAETLVKVLHHPGFKLHLSDDEFALLKTRLIEGIKSEENVDFDADVLVMLTSPEVMPDKAAEPEEPAETLSEADIILEAADEIIEPESEALSSMPAESPVVADFTGTATQASGLSEPETETPSGSSPKKPTFAEYAHIIEQTTEQAEQEGYHGLYDVGQMIVEALYSLPQGEVSTTQADLQSVLDRWAALVDSYRQHPLEASKSLVNVLRHPGLELPLSDEDFAMLESLLTEGFEPEAEEPESVLAPEAEEPEIILAAEVEEPLLLEEAEASPALELKKPDIASYKATIEQLAEEAAQEGYHGLYDVSFMMVEGLEGIAQAEPDAATTELLSLLDNWSALIETYRKTPAAAIPDIVKIMRHPGLKMPLSDDEFNMLESLLAETVAPEESLSAEPLSPSEEAPESLTPAQEPELAVPAEQQKERETEAGLTVALAAASEELSGTLAEIRVPEPKAPDVNALIATIEELAEQAGADGYHGLQDVSYLLLEALHEMPQSGLGTEQTDVLALLERWPSLISDYRHEPLATSGKIINVLRHPGLNLPLSDEDFSMLESLLDEAAGQETIEAAAEPQHVLTDIQEEPQAETQAQEEILVQAEPSTPEESLLAAEPQAQIQTEVEEAEEPIAPISKMARELVELLETEAGLLEYRFLDISFDEPAKLEAHLQQAEEELERLANASTMVGFAGLAKVCAHVSANMSTYTKDFSTFTPASLSLLKDWIVLVKVYIPTFSQNKPGQKVLAHLSQANWPIPLGADDSAEILTLMQATAASLNEMAQEEGTRVKTATDEDVLLELPGDVNQELLELLLQELPGYTQHFSEAVQQMQSGNATLKDIDVAQRIAHTIKGSANTVGIKGIAVLTHQLEDILMACAKERTMPGAALIDMLIHAADCLENMCDFLLGQGEPPNDARLILQEVLDWANQIDKKGVEAVNSQAPMPAKRQEPKPMPAQPAAQAAAEKPAPQQAKPSPGPAAKAEDAEKVQTAMVRVPTEQIENLFRLSSESIILNGQIYERQRRMKLQLQAMDVQFALLQQLGAELEQLIDVKDLSGRSANAVKNFDALEMDQYNELHTASRRMVEAAVDAREISVEIKKDLEHLHEVLEYQQRLVIDTQEAVMQTRFVPVGSIALRLQRGLRQTCRLTGKQGELQLSGEGLLIDGDTLGALVDPLMHMLRNAIDHGLESEDERIALGKPAVGKINIDFDREGNTIVVRCRDDGHGLNYAAIRASAEKRGLIRSDEIVTEDELKRYILRPNFSTREQSTQTSGRGVGMDAVNFQVLAMGGTLTLNSVQGQGLMVELRMPLPLSRSHALLANVGPYKVAISSKGLTQILYSGIGELQTINNQELLIIGEDIYPVKKLDDLLHVDDRRKSDRHHGAVLLVQDQDKITAVLVDSISDSRDVVIKNLGYYMRKIHGFVGATILGDGSVTPVLDIPELLRSPMQARAGMRSETVENVADYAPRLPMALVVEDSLSQRRALEQILVDAGFRVLTARDGIEAVESLSHIKPDVVLTDLEMPRMNGIELTSHIRAQATSKNLPIIMVTSRSTEKHRQMAEEAGINYYLIKPVQDDDLLSKIHSLMNGDRINA